MSKIYKKVCRILSYFEHVSGVSVSVAIFSVGFETWT